MHCLIPAGGITEEGIWKTTKTKGDDLFPIKKMQQIFKVKFIQALKKEARESKLQLSSELLEKLYSQEWKIYSKLSYNGPDSTIEYLSKFVNKVAISNDQIISVTEEEVVFEVRDNKSSKKKIVRLEPMEFLRRFALHFLPHRFRSIRHYGFLSSRCRKTLLPIIQKIMGITPIKQSREEIRAKAYRKMGINNCCSSCKKGITNKLMSFKRGKLPSEKQIKERICRGSPL